MPFLTWNGFYRVTVSHLIIRPILTPWERSRDGTYYKLTAHKIFKARQRGEGQGWIHRRAMHYRRKRKDSSRKDKLEFSFRSVTTHAWCTWNTLCLVVWHEGYQKHLHFLQFSLKSFISCKDNFKGIATSWRHTVPLMTLCILKRSAIIGGAPNSVGRQFCYFRHCYIMLSLRKGG